MRDLSDAAVARLRDAIERPSFDGTRYRLIDELGRGGMGTVWRALDLTLEREVAVKVLSIAPAATDASSRMAREARIMARLEHPAIVPIHDAGTLEDERVFYVMKLVRGLRLDEWIRDDRALTERLRLLVRVSEAVAFAHAHGVVHRDLKPQNIMVGAFGEVFVMDWGVATALDGHPEPREAGSDVPRGPGGTAAGLVVGTPGYMAPEQASGEAPVDRRADVFALGAVLRYLVTGSHPDGHAIPKRIPKALRAIVAKAMAPDPAARYARAEDFADDVSRWLDGRRVEAHDETAADRVGRWIRKYRVAIAIVAAYLIMRVLVLLWLGR